MDLIAEVQSVIFSKLGDGTSVLEVTDGNGNRGSTDIESFTRRIAIVIYKDSRNKVA